MSHPCHGAEAGAHPPSIRPHRGAVRVLLVVLAAAAVAVPAGRSLAQAPAAADTLATRGGVTLEGFVRDPMGNPIEGAELRVGRRLEALSDAAGAYVLRGVPPGTTQLEVRRIGFRPRTVPVNAPAAGARHALDVELQPNAVQLGTVVVEGRAYDRALWTQGYYQRRGAGSGHFFDPDYLAGFGGSTLGSLMREVPRIDLYRTREGEFAFGRIAGRACRMNVFVDGEFARYAMPASRDDPGLGLDQVIARADVHAVEVYPTVNMVPHEFTRIGPSTQSGQVDERRGVQQAGGRYARRVDDLPEALNDAACGAIVIWSKPFMERRLAADSARGR